MHKVIKVLRWSLHKISIALLANAVAVAVPLFAFSYHITNPQVMKTWLSETNTYKTLIDESLNLIRLDAENASTNGTLGDTLDENPFINTQTITDALSTTLTPDFIKLQSEDFIDGIYRWLNREVDVPDFRFSLATKNAELAAKLGSSLQTQLSTMPICAPQDITQEFNLLTNRCRPEGIDLTNEVDKFVAQLAGDNGLLSGAEWTGEDLVNPNEESGGLSNGQIDFALTAYAGLKDGPNLLIIAGAISIPFIFLSSKSKYRGFNEIGNTLFSGALFTFIPAVIISRWENLITSFIGETGTNDKTIAAARAVLEPFLQKAVHDVAILTAYISGSLVLIGGLLVVIGLVLKKRYQDEEDRKIIDQLVNSGIERRIKTITKQAKKNAKFKDKTLDPKTKKRLKPQKTSISKEQAKKIAHDPKTKHKKISEIK